MDASKVKDRDAELDLVQEDNHPGQLRFIYSQCPQEYAEWLRKPLSGVPQDPLFSVPDVVDDVREQLGLSSDAARYYLQLLALHDPTDLNVQAWNKWKKKDRITAGEELVHRGLVVEAKRSRARRSLFLPGPWIKADSPHLPMEVWKAEAFKLKNTDKVKPTIYDVVFPPRPFPLMFRDAWNRVQSGDGPDAQLA